MGHHGYCHLCVEVTLGRTHSKASWDITAIATSVLTLLWVEPTARHRGTSRLLPPVLTLLWVKPTARHRGTSRLFPPLCWRYFGWNPKQGIVENHGYCHLCVDLTLGRTHSKASGDITAIATSVLTLLWVKPTARHRGTSRLLPPLC